MFKMKVQISFMVFDIDIIIAGMDISSIWAWLWLPTFATSSFATSSEMILSFLLNSASLFSTLFLRSEIFSTTQRKVLSWWNLDGM